MEPSESKRSENNLVFKPVNHSEELTLQSNPQVIEDDDAWMREDAISLEDEDEEKQEVLPFGLNQSWPRVSCPSSRRDTFPKVHPKKKLLRQISQESLDESTNLLLGHIVMLPDPPQELLMEKSLFAQHPLVEEDHEQLHLDMSENIYISEERKIDVQEEQDNSVQVSDARLLGSPVSGKEIEEQKNMLPDLESIEKDCCDSDDNHLEIPTDSDSSKPVQNSVGDICEDQILKVEPTEVPMLCDIKDSENEDVDRHNLNTESEIQGKSEETVEIKTGIENEVRDSFSGFNMNAYQGGLEDYSEQDVHKNHSEHGEGICVPPELPQAVSPELTLETEVITSPERSVRKKVSPGGRRKPPLLRYLSQESIEESTNLLMDHVVMMDLQQKPLHTSPEGTESRCPYLVDIKESPLLDEDTIRKVNEEDEMFLFQGEDDSCEEEEEEGQKDIGKEALKDDSLLSIASKSFVSDAAASTLKDIELIRVELDNAIHAFENLKDEFPDRIGDSLLPKADDVILADINDDEDWDAIENVDSSAFGILPDEILINIFKYFSHSELCDPIMLVCKKWNILAKDPLLWHYLDLSNKAGIPSDVLQNVFQRCSLLHGITFRGRDEVSTQEIQAIIDYCPDVASLEFGFVRSMQDDQFSLLISRCRSLTSLNMEGCDGITDSLISKLILLPKLRCLNLSHCTKLTDGAVFEIARFCDHLEELNINGIPWITDVAVTMLCDERLAKLKCLRLDGAELTDLSIHHVVQCPNLEELNISFCEQLTDYSLTMLKEWKNPVRLRLQKGKEFSEEALANLFISPHLSNLTFLDLSECSELRDPGLINIATRCPLLTHLAIEWCWFISDVSLVQVLDNCRYLEHLDLIGLHSILGHCLADIPTKLPHLEFLDLRQCNRITDAMLVQIVSVKHNLVIMNYYGEEVVYGNIPGTLDI
ncbi:uncharacterized protein LOC121408036 [Lytechinus variegatus]|uniref:uncharacterized protein LOC121408036 n=1 Tax=Lytechinus variegatus TaxID=7654 RepID=UPI001BB2C34D|nr:uncharacterized protein LOC121408036 [Lytechinus variegatus]XP_041455291.1 uncharacterized protein LOC121408036 [Lytechinus variegatus]XP_041455298.1 uncharacterized protein LOC121408036 [Lytechinus variegatus]XP_041455307.1 uncharacterized protein LOC121408036 [Lytechinus variegatus]